MIVSENGVLRQKHKICDLEFIVHRHCSLLNEVYLAEFLPVGYNSCVWFVNPSEHVYNKLINESSLAVFKEVSELQLEIFKYGTNYLSLHLGRYLLIEIEFLNNEVKIVQKGIVNELLNVTIQIRWDIVGLVGSFDLFDPDI